MGKWVSSKICKEDSSGNTPLHVVAAMQHQSSNGVKVMEVLLENGVQHAVNDANLEGETAMHICSQHENSCDTVELLFKHNSTLDLRAQDGNTALHRACKNRCIDTACLLVHLGASLEELNSEGLQPLDLSCKNTMVTGKLQKRGFRFFKNWKERLVTIHGRWLYYAELENPQMTRGSVVRCASFLSFDSGRGGRPLWLCRAPS